MTPQEVFELRAIAETGMANRSKLGGPTIMDVNTGYVKDGQGLVNIYQKDRNALAIPRFTAEQFALYRRYAHSCPIESCISGYKLIEDGVVMLIRVIEKIRLALVEEFKLEFLYFTAPTFITRLVGNASWSPTEMHDEYW